MRNLTLATTTVFAASLLAPSITDASYQRITSRTATNACQPATPLQLGGLRYRPAGIYNNKPDPIYISCSLDTEFVSDNDKTQVTVYFNNQGASEQTVGCVAQGGSRWNGFTNVTGTLAVQPGANGHLDFKNLHVNTTHGKSQATINLSCLLPSQMEMGVIMMLEYADTGAL